MKSIDIYVSNLKDVKFKPNSLYITTTTVPAGISGKLPKHCAIVTTEPADLCYYTVYYINMYKKSGFNVNVHIDSTTCKDLILTNVYGQNYIDSSFFPSVI